MGKAAFKEEKRTVQYRVIREEKGSWRGGDHRNIRGGENLARRRCQHESFEGGEEGSLFAGGEGN